MDVHIPRAVALGLQRRGIDVVRAQEVNLSDASDEEHLNFAASQERVMVTQDAGFIDRIRRGEPNYGVAFCEQGSRSIGAMIAGLALIYQVIERDEMVGRVEYL